MRHSASSKLRPVLIAVGIIIVIAFVAIGLIIRQAQARYQSTIYTGNSSTKIDTTKPLSILLLGVDTGADGRIDKGNSDTIMVVTINPQTKKTLITSIPRDSLAEMVGDQDTNVQKLNAAYNIGGSKMAKASVSKLFNVPIDYYATINMGGLKQIVDAVGGVTITSPLNVSFDHITVTKGNMKHIQSTQVIGSPAWINTSSYQILSTKTLQQTSDRLRTQLGLSTETLTNMETKLNAKNTVYDGKTNLNYDTQGLDKITYSDNTK